ncbi:hypothetical protein PA15_0310245 [Pseudomonas aeruginosa HB15]|nr:hypothetical protein T223_19510 [Pseudomonas aeruginosa LES431]AHH53043.1 hypothetical protein AI22_15535 [Pseudomonas aeruginosa YL84]AHK86872.1 hypothetical protein T227_19450 [Pseudomonas aeruginosa LESlike5]AHK92747.1 hypothetical protein T228_19135 [Pseudomonas aeruginosa LESlike7]AHK98756.1 hypothetical protein T222_19840 [Pseudomonas aeruginosa LES400]AHL04714.1 hypothetical protein T224_19440 [Pseudomonas aeruginosa LESB65]AHL10641.1 hypothetical protein T225_19340 [Pseudomonas aer
MIRLVSLQFFVRPAFQFCLDYFALFAFILN